MSKSGLTLLCYRVPTSKHVKEHHMARICLYFANVAFNMLNSKNHVV